MVVGPGLMAEWMDVEDKLDNHYIAAFLQNRPQYDRTIYEGVRFVRAAVRSR